jgi:hypothetical protein
MKKIFSVLSIGIFILLYYFFRALTLPFFWVRLFANVAADNSHDGVMTRQRKINTFIY